MSDQPQHPTLDGQPVMLGDLLETDEPLGYTMSVQFRVDEISWDPVHGGGGAIVRSNHDGIERHLRDCRRVRRYRPPELLCVEVYSVAVSSPRPMPAEPASLGSTAFMWRVTQTRTRETLAMPARSFPTADERDAMVQLLWPDLWVMHGARR